MHSRIPAVPRLLVLLFLVLPVAISALAIPDTTITRTNLTRRIDAHTATIAVGIEGPFNDSADYSGDMFFAYAGYAPADWVEFGAAVHTPGLSVSPGIDAKIDLLEPFVNDSPLSLLLAGGVVWSWYDEEVYYHGGGAGVWSLGEHLQLCVGAGVDSYAQVWSFQTGIVATFPRWVGGSVQLKILPGSEGIEFTICLMPFLFIDSADQPDAEADAQDSS